MARIEVVEIVPLYLVDAPVLVNDFGDVAFAFAYTGLELLTSTKERLLEVNEVVQSSFSFLGEGFVIQQQDIMLESTYRSGNPEFDHFVYNSFFKYYDGKKYYRKFTYCFVIKMNGKGEDRTYSTPRAWSKHNSPKKINDIDTIRTKVMSFVKHLKSGGISLTPIPDDLHIFKLYQGFLSGYEESSFNDLTFSENEIVMGSNKKLRISAINSDDCLPESLVPYKKNEDFSNDRVKMYSEYMYGIGYGLKGNHVVNTMIFIDNQATWKDELEARSKRLNSLSLAAKINKRMSEDNDKFIKETYQGKGKLIVRAHLNVMYWADTKEGLDDIESRLGTAYQKIGMTPHKASYLNQKALFFSSMPGNGATLPFKETFLTHAHIAAGLISKESVIDRSKGNSWEKGPSLNGLITTDRVSGIPSYRDSWFGPYKDKKITARNSAAIGKTGGGKTVGVINDLYQYWLMGFYVCCIDIGRSLEVICNIVGGNYVIYQEGMSLGINPYAIQDNQISANKLEYLSNFTNLLWRPGTEMDETQNAALEQVLLAAYSATKGENDKKYNCGIDASNYGFKDFYRWVDTNQDLVKSITKNNTNFFDIDSFLLATKQFFDGKYSNLFTSKEGIDLLDVNNRFTVFELDNIIDNPTLFPIYSMLITHLTTEVMWNRKGINKFFWYEEAWKVAMKRGMSQVFIYLLKTIRKFDGGFGVSIQEIANMDIPGSNLLEVFINNVDVWNFTYQPEAEAENTARRLKWIKDDKPTDLRFDLLRSIHNDLKAEFPYMERLNVIGSDAKITQNMLSPEQVAAFMSDMDDKEILFPYIHKNGGDYIEGIKEYVAEEKERKKRATQSSF